MEASISVGVGSTTPILTRRSIDVSGEPRSSHNVVLPWAGPTSFEPTNDNHNHVAGIEPDSFFNDESQTSTPSDTPRMIDEASQAAPTSVLWTFGPIFATMFSMSLVSGLLIPLLALILERQGESALFNGISTMTVYVSFIIASPFIAPLNSWIGPRKTVAAFLLAAAAAVLAFPVFRHTYPWIAFRLIFGTSLSAVSVTTEIWLNKVLTDANRGVGFAGYGFSFTSGLAIGPLCIGLIDVSEYLPFVAGAFILLAGVALTLFLSHDERVESTGDDKATAFRRSWGIFTLAPHCMASAFVFGFMDGVLNGDLPIWGSRVLLSTGQISACLTVFVLGTIFSQIPLGYLSDVWGRRQTLLLITTTGFFAMASIHFTTQYFYGLLGSFFTMGASLGPTYSLGLAFLGDTVKSDDITLANVLYMMTYGVGSLFGPFSVSLLISVTDQPGPFVWVSLGVIALYMAVGVIDSHPVRVALRSCCP